MRFLASDNCLLFWRSLHGRRRTHCDLGSQRRFPEGRAWKPMILRIAAAQGRPSDLSLLVAAVWMMSSRVAAGWKRGGFSFVCSVLLFFLADFAGAALPAYPLKVSANRRYLVEQSDAPFLYHGDAAWSLIVGLTDPETELYLENRRRKGFNSLYVNLIENKFASHPPKTAR